LGRHLGTDPEFKKFFADFKDLLALG